MAATTETPKKGALQRRRIIERPRLLARLDGSKARIRLLVAPAGFGKTTLVDQWIARDGRTSAWFRARRSSTDVAALALDLARAASGVVPGCDERLREHLRAVPAPGENVEVLAEILGEDLGGWPATAWLVIDEYQEITAAQDAERFVEALIDASPAQFLVASRIRPMWATERRIIYGDVFELGRAELAMDREEGEEVLAHRGAPAASGLLEIANGWPAVIGLASVSPAAVDQLHEVPDSLYGFFAEEVFGSFPRDVQTGLQSLAVAPVMDRALAAQLLGSELADLVCGSALDAGVMVERAGQLELHPLARSFLDERRDQSGNAPQHDIAKCCLAHYRMRRDWEAAFELIVRHGPRDHLESLLQDALDELLGTGRLSTIETWCAFASKAGSEAPLFALAKSEVALRKGRFTEAQTNAEAASGDEALRYRALAVAGRAAHLDSREEEALDFYRRAETAARTDTDSRDAVWGQLVCLIDLERPEATGILKQLSADVVRSDPSDVVRCAGRRLAYQFKLGNLDLAEADRAYELLDNVRDPLIRASFQCGYGAALSLAARYENALSVAESAIELARHYRLDFALLYAQHTSATALAGHRQWPAAHSYIEEALQASLVRHNAYAQHICLAAKIRILAQEGRHAAAVAVDVPRLSSSLPSGEAEALASRALVLASVSRLGEASALVGEIRDWSSAVEPTVLISAVDAIVALRSGDPRAPQQIASLAKAAIQRGAPDLLVTAYRSAPELLGLLLRGTEHRDEVARIVVRARDEDLASATGQPLALDDPRTRLSPREREVFEQLQQGLTNAQIATSLFIAESTVKVHVHRIFDKLGVRSRHTIALQALLQGRGQATSAIEATDAAADSPLL